MKQPDGHELIHRIRIGLTGLACVFLLVLLGAVFARLVRDGESQRNRDAVPSAHESARGPAAPSDPLADLGVAPGNPEQVFGPDNRTAP